MLLLIFLFASDRMAVQMRSVSCVFVCWRLQCAWQCLHFAYNCIHISDEEDDEPPEEDDEPP